MTVACIVQGRTGSARLRNKVLMALPSGGTVFENVLRRCQMIDGVDVVVAAVPDTEDNDPLAHLVSNYARGPDRVPAAPPVNLYRGHESDVLQRYRMAAKAVGASIIMRVTGDCPMICPATCSTVLTMIRRGEFDYVSNCHPRTFPKGLDCEVFTYNLLARADEVAQQQDCREHVTLWMYRDAPDVRMGNLFNDEGDLSSVNFCIDTFEDYRRMWDTMMSSGPA